MLIIGLNELKWDSPGSCWHNEWLCGEAQNVNDEDFWKALEFVNNKSSYSPQNLTICSQQQRRTQRPLFNKMIQKQDTKGIRGYLYWHNTASKLCPQVEELWMRSVEHIVNWITTVLFLLSLFQYCYRVSCVSNSQGLGAFQLRLCWFHRRLRSSNVQRGSIWPYNSFFYHDALAYLFINIKNTVLLHQY